MTRVAKETGLVTQMGNNGHGGEGLRLTREWIQAGAIGPVREVHCWSDRPGKWWTQDLERPSDRPPVPADLDWNLWLGGCPGTAVSPRVCSAGVARLVRFRHRRSGRHGHSQHGSGLLRPRSRHADGSRTATSPLKKESYPAWQILTYEFAAKGNRPAVKLTWYDGGKMPAQAARVRVGPSPGGQRHLLCGRPGARSFAAVGPGRRAWSPRAR